MPDIFETFSHTHRGFDLSKPVPTALRNTIVDMAASPDNLWHPVIIEDSALIHWIYDQSEIPLLDKFKLGKSYRARKNSQLLAPLLIGMSIPKGASDSGLRHLAVGKAMAKIAHHAIAQGFQNGFCVCYGEPVEKRLKSLGLIPQDHGFCSTPFLAIGQQTAGKTHDWCGDTNMNLGSAIKLDQSQYITIA